MEEQSKFDIEKLKRENAALRRYAAIRKATEEKVCVQKIYIDITGDIESAFVLDEIIFFTLPKEKGISSLRVWKDGVLWLAVQRAEWWERRRITPRQADTAIKKLEEMNLVVKSTHKFNGQTAMHLRLNVPEFFKRYTEQLEKSNPPEDEGDTIVRDLSDLYQMMSVGIENVENVELQNGESQIRELQNGETESQIRETESPNGDSINSPHTVLTQSVKDDVEKNLSIENAIFLGKTVTREILKNQSLKDIAPKMFEKALGFSKPLPWWSDKEWTAFAEWVCARYSENIICFGEYNIWRNTKYTKGGLSNSRIRGFVMEFYDSWDMFMMSKQPVQEEPVRPELKPYIPEDTSDAVPNPFPRPAILRKSSSLDGD